MTTKQEIEEFRKYLKNPEKVKEDILQQENFNQQKIEENIWNGYKDKYFNYPNAFSLENICDTKLIPTNYCWDADAKQIVGYPNHFLYSYPVLCKNPRFITFLDINPNHDINYYKQIKLLYTNLTANVNKSTNVFDFNELMQIDDLDEIIKNIIIPGFLKTLDNAEETINSDKMSIPDLFITHNYSLKDLYEKLDDNPNSFLYNLFHSNISKNDFLNTFLSRNGLIFNWDDLCFVHSLIENNFDKISSRGIYFLINAISDIFTSRYQKTPDAYYVLDEDGNSDENCLDLIEDWLIDLGMRNQGRE